jgi:hypothetical protein
MTMSELMVFLEGSEVVGKASIVAKTFELAAQKTT